MKRFFFAVALWFAGCAAALGQQTGPIYCGQMATAAPSSATTTKVVSKVATGSGKTYLCGWHISAQGGTSQLVYATTTSSPCDGTQTILSPIYASGAVGDDQSAMFRGALVPNGSDICIITGASTTGAQAIVYFEQQ